MAGKKILMSKPGGYIYAIGAEGTDFVKIGSTRVSVEKRMKGLQTGQPFPLRVLAVTPVQENMRYIEVSIHRFLDQERQRGEWFLIKIEDNAALEQLIVRALSYVAKQEETQRLAKERIRLDSGELQWLQQWRQAHNLTQREAATLFGVHPVTYAKWEVGMRDLEGAALRLAELYRDDKRLVTYARTTYLTRKDTR